MGLTMTPEQALELLNKATAQLVANRASHQQIVMALEILGEAIKSK